MKSIPNKKIRILLAAMLAGSGLLFAAAINVERGGESTEESSSVEGEASESEEHSEEKESSILGLDLESPLFVALGVGASMALAVLLLVWRSNALLWLVAAFAGLFGLLDLREVFHQVNERTMTLVVLAAVLVVAHFGASLVAARAASRPADV